MAPFVVYCLCLVLVLCSPCLSYSEKYKKRQEAAKGMNLGFEFEKIVTETGSVIIDDEGIKELLRSRLMKQDDRLRNAMQKHIELKRKNYPWVAPSVERNKNTKEQQAIIFWQYFNLRQFEAAFSMLSSRPVPSAFAWNQFTKNVTLSRMGFIRWSRAATKAHYMAFTVDKVRSHFDTVHAQVVLPGKIEVNTQGTAANGNTPEKLFTCDIIFYMRVDARGLIYAGMEGIDTESQRPCGSELRNWELKFSTPADTVRPEEEPVGADYYR